jgi:phage gp46-like protein
MAVDVKLTDLGNGHYDLTFEKGKVATTSTGENIIYTSLFTNARASRDDVADPLKREGWIGSLYRNNEKGSHVWLLFQSRNTIERRNLLRNYIENCLQWAIDAGIIEGVNVTVDSRERGAYANIEVITDIGKVNNYVTLWEI